MNTDTDTPDLARLQADFKRHLQGEDESIATSIVDDPLVGSRQRLGIYQYAYYARLIDALAEDFPAVHTLLGDEAFAELCREYTRRHPSTHPSLRWFGQHMADFLAMVEPYHSHPCLAELARFEWSLIMAFDARDVAVAGEADAARVPPEQWPALRISLHPGVHLFSYRWNILPLWQASKDESEMPEPQQLPAGHHGVIWRQELTTRFRTLEEDEYRMLQAVMAGQDFAALCEQLAALTEETQAPLRAAGILRTWLAEGMVDGFD